jgi:hypothetical protein
LRQGEILAAFLFNRKERREHKDEKFVVSGWQFPERGG